jgi:hypothetical protein
MMMLPWLTAQPLLTMAVTAAVAFAERDAFRPSPRPMLLALAALALLQPLSGFAG